MALPPIIKLLGLMLLVSTCSKADEDCIEASTCETSSSDGKATPLVQDLAPLPGDGPTFSAVTEAGYTISWTAALDQVTSAANLEYRLVRAGTREEMDNINEALNLSDSSIVMDWAAATLSKAILEVDPQSWTYAVLVRDEVMNIALYPPQSLLTDGPAPGSAAKFSAVTDSGFTISWGAASSSFSRAENLEYRVVRAPDVAAIDSVAEAEAATDVVLDWTKNTFTVQVSGVSANTTFAVVVLVRDESERMAIYTPQSVKTSGHRLIFKTNTQFRATQLTPSANADALCNADSAKPPGRGTFKALISGNDRIACTSSNCSSTGTAEHVDWVMEANRTYENMGEEDIWTTNAFGVVLNGSHLPIYPSSNQSIWTGIDVGWVKAASNCSNWTSISSAVSGRVGTANATIYTAWTAFDLPCSVAAAIYCVEQ